MMPFWWRAGTTTRRRGREAAERYGMEFESSYEALVSRADIDAVIITRRDQQARGSDRRGDVRRAKHILCQKPMATTLEDCDRMIEAVEKSGVHFQMAFQMRCDPLNQQIKKMDRRGRDWAYRLATAPALHQFSVQTRRLPPAPVPGTSTRSPMSGCSSMMLSTPPTSSTGCSASP